MIFKKGDKVAFLNEAIQGIVVDYINDSHVLVNCKGLEIDVHASELIRITHIAKVDGKHQFPIEKEDRKIDEMPNLEKKSSDYQKLKIGDQVNFTSDTLSGTVIGINSADEYEVEIEDGFSIPANRLEIELVIIKDIELDEKGLRSKIKSDKSISKRPKSTPHSAPAEYREHHEFDLHIEDLTDNWRGMSNFEILTIQMSYFRNRLQEAFSNNEKFLVVIHGVGKGVLRKEIHNYLSQYPNLQFCDADAKLYGMGATEIRIY